MTNPKQLHKLNWRHILLHFIAACLMGLAFQQFSFLSDMSKFDALSILRNSGATKLEAYLKGKNFTMADVIIYFYYAKSGWVIGALIAFIISLAITKRKRWFWINSPIAFLATFIIGRLNYLDWNLKLIFLQPKPILLSNSSYLLISGVLLLILAFFLFFSKKSNHFIAGRVVKLNQNL